MKSFKQFLRENTDSLTHRPQLGSGNIFTQSAGYTRNPQEEFNPETSRMIHMTNHFPLGGKIETLGSHTHIARETVHFTRNGPVTDHMWGKWSDKKFGIMIPESGISHRLVNHGSHDSFTLGNVHIPSGSKISVNWDALENHERDHIQALTKSTSHEETRSKLNTGHEVNFDGRKVTLHGTQENESTHQSIYRHLRSEDITPVDIGHDYATGWSESPSDYERKYGSELSRQRFDDVYGSSGFISKFYQKHNRSANFADDSDEHRFARSSSGGHAGTIFSGIERNISWTFARHQDSQRNQDENTNKRAENNAEQHSEDAKSLARTLQQVSDRPENFHPTAYSSPESREAIKRIMTKLTSAHSGVSPTEVGPSQSEGEINRKNAMIKATKELSGNK